MLGREGGEGGGEGGHCVHGGGGGGGLLAPAGLSGAAGGSRRRFAAQLHKPASSHLHGSLLAGVQIAMTRSQIIVGIISNSEQSSEVRILDVRFQFELFTNGRRQFCQL